MIHCYEFYASPVISKPRYFEHFSISLGKVCAAWWWKDIIKSGNPQVNSIPRRTEYFLFLYNLILLFLIGNTCTEMVILNKLVLVIAIIICWIHSSAFHWFMWDSSVCESFDFFISVHLKISALFEVNDFLSAEVFPAVMDVKINPGFWTQKKTPFPLSRGHLSLH